MCCTVARHGRSTPTIGLDRCATPVYRNGRLRGEAARESRRCRRTRNCRGCSRGSGSASFWARRMRRGWPRWPARARAEMVVSGAGRPACGGCAGIGDPRRRHRSLRSCHTGPERDASDAAAPPPADGSGSGCRCPRGHAWGCRQPRGTPAAGVRLTAPSRRDPRDHSAGAAAAGSPLVPERRAVRSGAESAGAGTPRPGRARPSRAGRRRR